MRDWLKSKAGWLLVLVPLALPNCSNDWDSLLRGDGPPTPASPAFDPGQLPHGEAIFCDIEDPDNAPGKISVYKYPSGNFLLLGIPMIL